MYQNLRNSLSQITPIAEEVSCYSGGQIISGRWDVPRTSLWNGGHLLVAAYTARTSLWIEHLRGETPVETTVPVWGQVGVVPAGP